LVQSAEGGLPSLLKTLIERWGFCVLNKNLRIRINDFRSKKFLKHRKSKFFNPTRHGGPKSKKIKIVG